MSDPMYDEESIEMQGGKVALTPLWNYVTKPEGEEVVEATSFRALMIVMEENHSGSYIGVRRQFCGVLDSDDKKSPIGISIFPNVSME